MSFAFYPEYPTESKRTTCCRCRIEGGGGGRSGHSAQAVHQFDPFDEVGVVKIISDPGVVEVRRNAGCHYTVNYGARAGDLEYKRISKEVEKQQLEFSTMFSKMNEVESGLSSSDKSEFALKYADTKKSLSILSVSLKSSHQVMLVEYKLDDVGVFGAGRILDLDWTWKEQKIPIGIVKARYSEALKEFSPRSASMSVLFLPGSASPAPNHFV